MAKFQIALKSHLVEQKRLGLEKMLTALLRRHVTVVKLIRELGMSREDAEVLELRAIGRISEGLIDYIEQSLLAIEGGDRRYAIIERYYGLDGYLPARLSAMSAKYGISRERVRQLKERALAHWRNPRQMNYLAQALRLLCYRHASFNFSPSPVSAKLNDNSLHLQDCSVSQLSLMQSQALEKILLHKGGVITGCAGSGKTTVAMELAKRLALQGKRVLLTCFSRPLGDFLQEELRHETQITVASFHVLCLRFARATKVSVTGGFNQRSFIDRFPEFLREATARDAKLRFDAVIVDDAHEFYSNWWQALRSCLAPGSGEMYSFIDDHKLLFSQNIEPVAHLSKNHRSKGNLALFLKEFHISKNEMEVLPQDQSRQGPVPEFYLCQTGDEIKATASYVVSNWVLEKNIRGSDIVILTPRLPKFSPVYQARLKNGLRLVTKKSRVQNHIWLSRISGFKGVERKAVIILDLDDRFSMLDEFDKAQLLYSAISRATEYLCIIGNNDTWNFINSDVARRLSFYKETEELVGTVGNTTCPASYQRSDQ